MILTRSLIKRVLLGASLLLSTYVHANTVSYLAITDFPTINAGEVPFYVDAAREALAVNAAIVEYRDRFAKAEVVFDGQPGVYQFTLLAIAENDGEADYRLSVNGEIVGLATNPEVAEDFARVSHEFADINVPAGAVIAVESLANSNEKIPENDEFAFARGRWTALELTTTGEDNSDPDLSITGGFGNQEPQLGDEVELSLTISNAIESDVATGVVALISVPDSALELVDQSVCRVTPTGIECPVAELPAGESVDLAVSLRAIAAPTEAPIVLGVSADQPDRNEADNTVAIVLSIADNTVNVVPDTVLPEAEIGATSTATETDGESAETADNGGNSVTDSGTSDTSSRSTVSSGGALSVFGLFVFFVCLVTRVSRDATNGM